MASSSEPDRGDPEWWDAASVAALPAYLLEPRPRWQLDSSVEVHHGPAEAAATWVWLATSSGPGSATMAPYPAALIITRRIGLSPPATVEAVKRWWREHEHRPVLTAAGDWLELGTPCRSGEFGCLCRLRGRLHLKWTWPPVGLEIDVAPWSASETEVDLRAEGTIRGEHRRRRFFAAGHYLADRLAEEMMVTAS